MKQPNLVRSIVLVLSATAITGCIVYPVHNTVTFERLTYHKTAELQLNKCLKDLVNTNSTVRVKAITSNNSPQNVEKLIKVSKEDFVEFCMVSNGIYRK